MADTIRYVDTSSSDGDGTTDATSGANAAYASLGSFDVNEAGTIAAGNRVICYCNNAGGDDTSVPGFTGWTVTDNGGLCIATNDTANDYFSGGGATKTCNHDGVWGAGYVLYKSSSFGSACSIQDANTHVYGLEARGNGTNNIAWSLIGSNVTGINLLGRDGTSGFRMGGASNLYNCQAADCDNGFTLLNFSSLTALNCGDVDCVNGVVTQTSGGSGPVFKNHVSIGASTADYVNGGVAFGTGATNATSYSSTTTPNITQTSVSTSEFTNYAANPPDFRLTNYGSSKLQGNGTSQSGTFTIDIANQTRSNWDIGPSEYVSAGATGTGTQTLPSLTQAGNGAQEFIATAAQTLASVTQAATGALTISGSAVQQLAALTQAGSGLLVLTGTAGQALPAVTQSASGTHVQPATGTSVQVLPAVTQAATGEHTQPATGTSSQTLPAVTQAASGELIFTAGAVQLLQAVTQAATGTSIVPRTGTGAQTLPAMLQAATGELVLTGTAVQTLPATTQTANGTHTAPAATGTSAQTLPAVTQDASGTHTENVSGTAGQTLPTVTQTASGNIATPVTGTGVMYLPLFTQRGIGAVVAPVPTFLDQVGLDLEDFFASGITAAQLATDLDNMMDATMSFGETVTVGGIDIEGIFDAEAYFGGDRVGPILMLQSSDVLAYSITHGITVTVRSTDYVVHGVQEDGVGVATVILQEA